MDETSDLLADEWSAEYVQEFFYFSKAQMSAFGMPIALESIWADVGLSLSRFSIWGRCDAAGQSGPKEIEAIKNSGKYHYQKVSSRIDDEDMENIRSTFETIKEKAQKRKNGGLSR